VITLDIDANHPILFAPHAKCLSRLGFDRSHTGKEPLTASTEKFGKPGWGTLIDVGAKAFNDIIRFAHKKNNCTIVNEP